MQVVVGRLDFHFRRKYLKGLLSIPSDGRGARRPLGQSSRESVGPAALYQVSAANRRDILIRRAYEHAMRCLPRHVLDWHYKEFLGVVERPVPELFPISPSDP